MYGRYLAKNIVNTGLADVAKVELTYDGSKDEPCAINVELINPVNSLIGLKKNIEKFIIYNVDLTPKGIICKFFPCGIKPIFYNTARNGHFGYNDNDTYYPWERVDFSDKLKEYIDEKELSIVEF
jgi:S-adenosylmethionine synthetase